MLVGQPMDTLKVKLQTFGHLYTGVWQCASNTLAKEGLRKGDLIRIRHVSDV